MKNIFFTGCLMFWLSISLCAQGARVWVLRAPGEAVEYSATTFAAKATVKVPEEAFASPQDFSVNSTGQMLFAATIALPLPEGEFAAERKVWVYDGKKEAWITRDVSRSAATAGSNLSISESAAVPYLSSDGAHIYWFANQARRLQRDGVDLSTKTTWTAWRTNFAGAEREDLATMVLPDCSCPTGGCEETCPYVDVWVPNLGVGNFFLQTQFVAGQTKKTYKSSAAFGEISGKWVATPVDPALQNILDSAGADAILEAIPDTACCGWSNESDDKTILRLRGKRLTLFDEVATFKNSDYDVSFYAQDGKLSPDLRSAAFTIVSTGKPNAPIQLAEQGQANPGESQSIRKSLQELPAVEIQSLESAPRRIALVPHAALVGWLNDKEILLVEEHQLVLYTVPSANRRKLNVRVEDAAHVFLR